METTMSWKPEVQVAGEGDKWCRNGLAFATKEEAEANAKDLMYRWLLVTACRAVESDEPVNYQWVDGKLVAVVPAGEQSGIKA
jgi:hypothetical protein